jgi:hypothetical protein
MYCSARLLSASQLGICNFRTCLPNQALVHFDIGITHKKRHQESSAYNGEVKRLYSNCLSRPCRWSVPASRMRSPRHDKRVNSVKGPYKQNPLVPNEKVHLTGPTSPSPTCTRFPSRLRFLRPSLRMLSSKFITSVDPHNQIRETR